MEPVGISAASWVVGKALSPLSGGVLEAWAASTKLGSNIEALKMVLLQAQGMLNSAGGREIHNPALTELLNKLRQLAYVADDVLDELDYFRIQDELDGTSDAADVHAAGCVQDLALHARHTARACVNKLKFPVCTRAATARHDDTDQQGKQGFLSGLRFCGGRREIGSSSRSTANNVGKRFSCFSSLPSVDHDVETDMMGNPSMTGNDPLQIPKLMFDRVEMSRKISDITEQLKPVCAMYMPFLDIAMSRPKSTPLIIEPKLYGRDSHKKIIVDEIVNSEGRGLTVLPIVGPGGIGKTTFTQHIYEQMKNHFQISIWICVSLDFNANRLTKDIVEKIPQVNNENKNCSAEELIEQRLKGKRVLLVLDDVWEYREVEWKNVIALFKKEGGKGNMVIVTTRISEVANAVKTTKYSLKLERLCSADIMSFFEECVFGDQKPWVDHPELVDIGSKIVDKLKGSPLAARTVGRLLRTKLILNHWRSVLESKEWESTTDDNDIMPALKLSYDYLPFHLQQCFSFCGLFPEDYVFGSEELVHLWIGLDILHSGDQKTKRLEDVGLCYLNDLVNYGFFKMNSKGNEHPYYDMHDLMHELAVKVSSHECLSIYSSNVRDIQIPPSVRHISIIVDDTDIKDKMSFEEYDGNLRALGTKLEVENSHTLMLFGYYHGRFSKTFASLFGEARALRIIFLCGTQYNIEDILHNFSKLVHLRYLRIETGLYRPLFLPCALFRLYHLVVIDLQRDNLVKMRHFLVQRPEFHSNICWVGKLKFLQELMEFRVGKESEGFEPSQLGQLKEIGSLGIYNLEKVQSKEEANEFKLIQKNHLRELILEWDVRGSNKDPVKEEYVLESLVPHSNLQELCIRGHGGTNCPTWLCTNLSVKCLESLSLDGLSWNNLPPLGEMWMINELGEEYQCGSISAPSFHKLKSLQLSNISRLKRWVGSGTCPIFSHLEVLLIKNCSELIELPFSCPPSCCQAQQEEKIGWFPRLGKLVIVDCPKLESLPPIPWRAGAPRSAEIARVGSGIERVVYPCRYRSKLSLEIEGKGGQGDVLWNGLNFSNLTDLEELCVNNVPPLQLDHLQLLTSLKKIKIYRSSGVLLPVGGKSHAICQSLVEELEIIKCDTSGKELTLLLSFLPSLSKLKIQECDNITGLGVVEHAETGEKKEPKKGEGEIITAAATEGLLLLPPHLQEVSILDCEKVSLLSGSLWGGGLQRLCSLRFLYVMPCGEFLSSYSSPSSSCFPFPACLQHLILSGVRYMETLQLLSNLTSLTELFLNIWGDSRDEGLWPLLAYGRLTKLTLYTSSDFFAGSYPSGSHDREVCSRSSKLFDLSTKNNTGVLAAPVCSLLSSTLTRFELGFTNEVECLTEEQEEALQLLTSLKRIRFFGGYKLHRLPEGLHKLINLKQLVICACSAIRSLPSLPNSLQELEIERCRAIKSLPNSLPSSLERLRLSSCNDIKSLPKDGLPSSMIELDVSCGNSQELKRECRKMTAIIPIVRT
ncbi:hypothetical protein VPH35_031588 [Triticum aestivum]